MKNRHKRFAIPIILTLLCIVAALLSWRSSCLLYPAPFVSSYSSNKDLKALIEEKKRVLLIVTETGSKHLDSSLLNSPEIRKLCSNGELAIQRLVFHWAEPGEAKQYFEMTGSGKEMHFILFSYDLAPIPFAWHEVAPLVATLRDGPKKKKGS